MSTFRKSNLPILFIALALLGAVGWSVFGGSSPDPVTATPEPTPDPAPITLDLTSPSNTPAAAPDATAPATDISVRPALPETPKSADVRPRLQNDELDALIQGGDTRSTRIILAKRFAGEITDAERRSLAQRALDLNQKTIVREPDPSEVIIHELQTGELLTTVARKYPNLHGQWGYLSVVNSIADPNRLRAGKKLRVPKGAWSLFADKSMFRLWLLYEGTPFKEYVVGIGKPTKPTPVGLFTVISKSPKPNWTPPADSGIKGILPYGHKDNPLGEYWIALQHDQYDGIGIHGTNDESVIGTMISNGCLRMHNTEVVEMGNMAYPGMTVTFVE